MSTGQTVSAAVQFIMGVTLFTADQDQPEAPHSTPAPHHQVKSDDAVRYVLIMTWLQSLRPC